jgi:hypothetical protein
LIYVDRAEHDDVFQGDIFLDVPFVDINLDTDRFFTEVGEDAPLLEWAEAVERGVDIVAPLKVTPRPAMIISQDCDLARDNATALLAAIDEFGVVNPAVAGKTSPREIQAQITRGAKISFRWFYLPIDPNRSFFDTKKAADFTATSHLSVADLLKLKRAAGLNHYAREHLRHRVAFFFQRYPVDEWYSLDAEEMEQYSKAHKAEGVTPYEWQRSVERKE